jgi:hypothetical protein
MGVSSIFLPFEAVWDVVVRDLPPLEFVMRSMLAGLEPER